MSWTHYLGYGSYYAGYYGTAVVLAVAFRLRPHLPHRHTGYVSIGGYVHACSVCGKLPEGATRTGFNGMPGYEPPLWAQAPRSLR